MAHCLTRREWLSRGAAAGAIAGVLDRALLNSLPAVSAAETQLDPRGLQLDSGIAPYVRLLETTPRDRLLEEVGARIRAGWTYRDVLAALLLAGVTNIEPRPQVGFKFHAVLVVNSAHLASLASPDEHRWLPIFWALDHYKSAEARDVEERGDWRMGPVNESVVPAPHRAAAELRQALDDWDEPRADAAIAGLTRSAGAAEIFELLFRYGARDFRSIGHKAIYAANAWRTLECIGWRHAEPVLRSLVYAMLMHEEGNPRDRDADADRPYRRNLELLTTIRHDWLDGRPQPEAARELVEALRDAPPQTVCELVAGMLNRGVAVQSIWDGLHAAAAEQLLRQPAIVALHSVTTTNALAYAFRTAARDDTRKLLLLQNAAFLAMFREAMHNRGTVGADDIGGLLTPPEGALPAAPDAALQAIFAGLHGNPRAAVDRAREYLAAGFDVRPLIDAARLLVFQKGDDAHDYKFSSAVLEDYEHLSPEFRDAYLAACVVKLRGADEADNPLAARVRAALG